MHHLSRFLPIVAFLIATPALPHTEHVKDVAYNYRGVLGGETGTMDCCDNTHCQPTAQYKYNPERKSWTFRVKKHPQVKDSLMVDVDVPEKGVIRRNLVPNDRFAHWCGSFDYLGKLTQRCAFVPIEPISSREHKVLDASLGLEAPRTRGLLFATFPQGLNKQS